MARSGKPSQGVVRHCQVRYGMASQGMVRQDAVRYGFLDSVMRGLKKDL